MINKKRPTIYSRYEISSILYFSTMVMFLPIVLVFTYIFDIELTLDVNKFIFITSMINLVFLILGGVGLYLRKNSLKRQVKASYLNEFVYLVVISMFGLLGFVVFYDYMNGDRAYIANILVVLFAALVYALIFLGRKFFNFDYMKKK